MQYTVLFLEKVTVVDVHEDLLHVYKEKIRMGFYQFKRQQSFDHPIERLWGFISNPKNLKKITPDYMGFDISSRELPDKMYEGMIISYRVSPVLGIKTTWVTEITHVNPGIYFVDEQIMASSTLFRIYRKWHYYVRYHKLSTAFRFVGQYRQ